MLNIVSKSYKNNFLQVSRVEIGKIIQRQHPHRTGLPEATLLHRQGRRHVQTHPKLHEKLPSPDTGELRRSGSPAGRSAILRHSA